MPSIAPPQIFNQQAGLPKAAYSIDAYTGACRELFFARNPKFRKGTPEGDSAYQEFKNTTTLPACWVYYADIDTLVHTLIEELYFELRTARNRNLISKREQLSYRAATIGIAGLSVGSAALASLVQSGGPKNLKIADFDTVEVSNLNRIRARLTDIGTNKVFVAAREAWLIDPFLNIECFEKGLAQDTIDDFIGGNYPLSIFIDQMDSLDLKIIARKQCRIRKIPVIMATDNGDGIILDIERFDIEPKRPLFHGLIEEINPDSLKALSFQEWLTIATKIVGPSFLTKPMQDSLKVIGQEITAVPQLGPTASIAGAAVAFAVREITTGRELSSGRYILNLEGMKPIKI